MTLRFLSRHLMWLAVLVSLGIGVLSVRTQQAMEEEYVRYTMHNNANLTHSLATGVGWALHTMDMQVQSIVLHMEKSAKGTAASELLKSTPLVQLPTDLSPDHFVNMLNSVATREMLALGPDGHVVKSSVPHVLQMDFSDQDYFQAFAKSEHQGMYVGRPVLSRLSGQWILPVARGWYLPDGKLGGVAVSGLDLQVLETWLAGVDMGTDGAVYVLRDDGLVLIRLPYESMIQNGRSLNSSENTQRLVSAPSGVFENISILDGIHRLYTFERVAHTPVIVNIAQARHAVLQPWKRNMWEIGGFTMALVLGCVSLAILFMRELERRRDSNHQLFVEQQRMRLTLNSISDAVLSTDALGVVTYLNPEAERMMGWSATQACGQHMRQCTVAAEALEPLRRVLHRGSALEHVRSTITHPVTQQHFVVDASASPIFDNRGYLLGAVAVLRNMTEAAAHAAHIQRMAHHDALTGLPNRALLQDRATQALALAQRNAGTVALVYIDLNGFKPINDHWGHEAGDHALVHVAQQLSAVVRASDTVCRIGGDEFVLMLQDIALDALQTLAHKVLHVFQQPFVWQGHSLRLGACGGISVYPAHGETLTELLRHADEAMYAAKQSGSNQIRLYECRDCSRVLVEKNFEIPPRSVAAH